MNDSAAPISRDELLALHARFREIKHDINNTLAVFMALSELGQRNPAHLEKLAKAVLERSQKVVDHLTGFSDQLGLVIKGETLSASNAGTDHSGALPAA